MVEVPKKGVKTGWGVHCEVLPSLQHTAPCVEKSVDVSRLVYIRTVITVNVALLKTSISEVCATLKSMRGALIEV